MMPDQPPISFTAIVAALQQLAQISSKIQQTLATIGTVGSIGLGQPNFSVYLSVNQSVTTNTLTKATFDTKNWDTGPFFDVATNHRFLPTVAGTYLFALGVDGGGTTVSAVEALIYKNGSVLAQGGGVAAGAGVVSAVALVQMNGSTDYVEGFGLVTASASPVFTGGAALTYLSGFRIGP